MKAIILAFSLLTGNSIVAQHCPFDGTHLVAIKVIDEKGNIFANGGRVLGVTALGNDIRQAIANVYGAIDFIAYDGMYFRKDIASKAI